MSVFMRDVNAIILRWSSSTFDEVFHNNSVSHSLSCCEKPIPHSIYVTFGPILFLYRCHERQLHFVVNTVSNPAASLIQLFMESNFVLLSLLKVFQQKWDLYYTWWTKKRNLILNSNFFLQRFCFLIMSKVDFRGSVYGNV